MANGVLSRSKSELPITNIPTFEPNNMSSAKKPDDDGNVSLQHELRHFFRFMGIFGLYFTPKRWQEKSGSSGCTPFLYKIHMFYCFFIQIILWLNVFRIAAGFWLDDDPQSTPLKITFAIWNLQSAVNGTIWVCLCTTDKLPNMFQMWQEYCQSSPASRMFETSLSSTCIKKLVRVVLVCAALIAFSNSSMAVFNAVGPIDELRNDSRFAMTPFSYDNHAWVWVINLQYIFANVAYVFPVAFFLLVCTLLQRQFKQLTNFFVSSIGKNGKFIKSFVTLRRQHQYVSKIVFLADDAFSFYLAATVTANIILECFSLYTVIISNALSGLTSQVMMVFWALMVAVNFGLVGVFAAQVNEKAHDIVDYIHDVGMFEISTNQDVAQMNMFLQKLNGRPIAFTLWNILPVTKEFILTVVGVFITYYALVVQTF